MLFQGSKGMLIHTTVGMVFFFTPVQVSVVLSVMIVVTVKTCKQ